jgi:hypothetical protein
MTVWGSQVWPERDARVRWVAVNGALDISEPSEDPEDAISALPLEAQFRRVGGMYVIAAPYRLTSFRYTPPPPPFTRFDAEMRIVRQTRNCLKLDMQDQRREIIRDFARIKSEIGFRFDALIADAKRQRDKRRRDSRRALKLGIVT